MTSSDFTRTVARGLLIGAGGLCLLIAEPDASVEQQLNDGVPLTAHWGLLLAARDNPSRFDRAALMEATSNQITFEQNAWRRLSRILEPAGPGEWLPRLIGRGATSPALIHEWQVQIERKPELARGDLMTFFLDPRADLPRIYDVFLFARNAVENRDPRFAARELVSVYERHLRTATTRVPTRFSLSVQLPAYEYDFDARVIRFQAQRPRYGAPPQTAADALDILYPLPRGGDGWQLPPETASWATYSLLGQRVRAPEVSASRRRSPAHYWQSSVTIGSSDHSLSPMEVLAFDRRAALTPIPLEPTRAEALLKSFARPDLSARLVFDVKRSELATRAIGGTERNYSVLFGSVQRIDVMTPDGEVLVSRGPRELPPATGGPAPAARR